jgi:hypothetical protein
MQLERYCQSELVEDFLLQKYVRGN